ncbi:hypothetical protein [Promicromonospora sp. AC04]|uniref:hypothetical protein n=1 Tax=Promicromonospora sp. AC04 TaxID=2135723 RepID=UPI000D37B490|nr:hypothetical protein [Promicromonospora sp. AC04]
MNKRPRHRTRWIVATVTIATVGTLVAVGYWLYTTHVRDRWAWRLADLDSNEIYLSGDSSGIEDGTVVKETRDHVVVKYSRPITDFTGTPSGEFDTVCYQFPFEFPFEEPDKFEKVPCP